MAIIDILLHFPKMFMVLRYLICKVYFLHMYFTILSTYFVSLFSLPLYSYLFFLFFNAELQNYKISFDLEAPESKLVYPVLNTIGVNSLRLGGLHLMPSLELLKFRKNYFSLFFLCIICRMISYIWYKISYIVNDIEDRKYFGVIFV